MDEWRNDDDQWHSREMLVQNISDACTENGRSPVLRSRHRRSRGTRNAVDDDRLGRDHPSASFGLIPSLPKRWCREEVSGRLDTWN